MRQTFSEHSVYLFIFLLRELLPLESVPERDAAYTALNRDVGEGVFKLLLTSEKRVKLETVGLGRGDFRNLCHACRPFPKRLSCLTNVVAGNNGQASESAGISVNCL